MLKTVVLFNIFVETIIYFLEHAKKNRIYLILL